MLRDDISTLKAQPPFHLWRYLRTQLGLPPAHRQRRRYQQPGRLRTGQRNLRIGSSARHTALHAGRRHHRKSAALSHRGGAGRRFHRAGRVYALPRSLRPWNPTGTPAFDHSTIPYYNVNIIDTWHMKPTFTLTYGQGWTLEMPPDEANGAAKGTGGLARPANFGCGLPGCSQARRGAGSKTADPEIGFAFVGRLTGNAGRKYPYNPFYGSFCSRLAAGLVCTSTVTRQWVIFSAMKIR